MREFNITTTPKKYLDYQEVIRITNHLARKGYNIDTTKRTHDWIAFVHNQTERWESGGTELEAVRKLAVTLEAG